MDEFLKKERKDLVYKIEEGFAKLQELKNFKDDHEIILKATEMLPDAISVASEDLKNKRRFNLKILKKY